MGDLAKGIKSFKKGMSDDPTSEATIRKDSTQIPKINKLICLKLVG